MPMTNMNEADNLCENDLIDTNLSDLPTDRVVLYLGYDLGNDVKRMPDRQSHVSNLVARMNQSQKAKAWTPLDTM